MTTKSTPKDLIDSFPHSKLTPIATATTEPDYLSLHQLQYEINDNAETLSSTLGDGQHGHLFLVISETEYLEMTDGIPCIPPVQPPFDPVHAANATAPQILFDLYHNAIKAFRNQLLEAIPIEYIESLGHPTRGFNKVSPLEILSHLWETFGKIQASDLIANDEHMKAAWHPPTPIQQLFQQLEKGNQFIIASGQVMDERIIARIGYQIIEKTGLFDLASRNWRYKDEADKTLANFKKHFQKANKDLALTATSSSAGYHTANQSTVTKGKSYCWTHGIVHNTKHTSATCEKQAPGHKTGATLHNKQGGSTKTYQYTPPSSVAPNTPPLASSPPFFPPDAIADTGCTGHFLSTNIAHIHCQPTVPGINVVLPDGRTITSSHITELNIPSLPPAARTAHIFPGLSNGSLISIGQLCDHGCTATFTSDTVRIALNNTVVLRGGRSPYTRLWTLDSPVTPNPPATELHAPVHDKNFANHLGDHSGTLADRIAFVHASLFSPQLSTWCKAIDKGRLTTFPDITSAQVKRHPPQSVPMVKGHLDQQRSNLRSTKPKVTLSASVDPDDINFDTNPVVQVSRYTPR
ncbi:predicted protein [Phaeodactylum tricornutum CCAP 1055/1]|uniref:Uncharacterized protein n=1 Tax=Phaeodactylum tricornutum (strain CCAP 1055/1) TaxID=556484 RepID=B5Y4B7_PHATC|nr:predicted protein [Phaeodactylum tricornutum CCAP 1055/1]ACI65279.1 predicted protein [Phaeodactylum tricornutum CCAP 1055/1]|eukprot:XP_002185809.1 predicted protein [Phaeodactylum tricornutum CCAP 1055/1]